VVGVVVETYQIDHDVVFLGQGNCWRNSVEVCLHFEPSRCPDASLRRRATLFVAEIQPAEIGKLVFAAILF
jgi:hypothetical protein